MPEYIVLLRRAREEHFDALQAEVTSAAPQIAAYEEGAKLAAARRAALLLLPATDPSALVGEELEVQRGGEGGAAAGSKFFAARVLAAPAKPNQGSIFTLAFKDDEANKAKVNLATTKWRPAGAPAPPRFEWSAAADTALLGLCEAQVTNPNPNPSPNPNPNPNPDPNTNPNPNPDPNPNPNSNQVTVQEREQEWAQLSEKIAPLRHPRSPTRCRLR